MTDEEYIVTMVDNKLWWVWFDLSGIETNIDLAGKIDNSLDVLESDILLVLENQLIYDLDKE